MNKSESELNNIKKSLMGLFSQLPDQFALSEVKSNLKRTIESIDKVQIKREKRKTQQEEQSYAKKIGFLNLQDAQKALNILNQMGKEQEKIINNSTQEKPASSSSEFLLG